MTEAKILRALLLFTLAVAFAVFLYAVRSVLAPFFWAGLLAFLMNPFVRFLELRGVRRHSAVTILYAVISAVMVGLAYWAVLIVLQDVPRLRYELPGYIAQARTAGTQLQAYLGDRFPWLGQQDFVGRGVQYGIDAAQNALRATPQVLSMVVGALVYLVMVPFIAYYLLREGRELFQSVIDACPGRWVEKFLTLFYEIDGVLGNYLRGVMIESICVAALSSIGLVWLGVEQPALIGAASGLGNIVPYLGPFVGSVLGMIVAFFQFHNVVMPIKVAALFAGVQFIDNWILQPMIMKRAVDLHPVLLLFALLAGAQVAGFWGLLLGVPVVCVAHELLKIFSSWWLSETRGTPVSRELWTAASLPWVV